MSTAPIEAALPESSPLSSGSVPERSVEQNPPFAHLRGVQWRINLGILPYASSSSSIDDLRRVTANSRRR